MAKRRNFAPKLKDCCTEYAKLISDGTMDQRTAVGFSGMYLEIVREWPGLSLNEANGIIAKLVRHASK